MAKYIEREAAYKTLTEYYHHTTEGMHSALREALSRVPAADVAPVVRCMDCYYYHTDETYCGLWRVDLGLQAFCSYGTRDGAEDIFDPNCGAKMEETE